MNALKEKRLAANLTQQQLSVKSGVATDSISKYELGKSKLRKSSVAALAKALKCKTAELEDAHEKK